jgi:hypothetical protein
MMILLKISPLAEVCIAFHRAIIKNRFQIPNISVADRIAPTKATLARDVDNPSVQYNRYQNVHLHSQTFINILGFFVL